MTLRPLSAALALLCAATLAIPASAQETAEKKKDPSGLGMFQNDRPKNAKTEITCKGEATFDNESGIATFVTGVLVKDPQFNLFCDKLTVYLNKDRKGIESAVAEGKVVIVQENKDEKGKATKSIGRGGKAVFTPASGEATLTSLPDAPPEGNWPSIQQGINNHIATAAVTVMILNRDGRLDTRGPSRTVITDTPAE